MKSMGRVRIIISILIFIVGCSIERSSLTCVEGTVLPCTCATAQVGKRICVNGAYRPCECNNYIAQETNPSTKDGSLDSTSTDNATKNTVDSSRSQNNAYSADTGSPNSLRNDSGSEDPSSTSSSKPTQPTNPDANSADTISAVYDSGKDSGNIQADVTLEPVDNNIADSSIASTDAFNIRIADSEQRDSNDDSLGTEVYGQCFFGYCYGEKECVQVFGGFETYCSIPCDDDEACPEVPAGSTATPRCSSLDSMCRLTCDSDLQCPLGMECVTYYRRSTCVWP